MTFSQADLPYLKWSLLTFALIATLGGSAVFFSIKYASDATKTKQTAQQQLTDARTKLNAARDDLQNMATYQQEFAAIQRRGIVGDEQRLNLIEDLDKLRRLNRVLEFKYGIAPQQAYKPITVFDTGSYDLKLSPMTLQLQLLHEGQLLNFFNSLRNEMKGWFILEKCAVERNTGNNTAARLKADCSGGWLTMKNRNAP